MSRWSRRAVLGSALALAAPGRLAAAQAPAPEPLSLRRGVNAWPWFALTREYPAPRTDYAWPPFELDRPVPRAADLRRLRAAGFDFIRLPVDPGPFLSFAGQDHDRLMASLDRAVEAVLAADLKIVVNIQANAATHFWTPERLYGDIGAPGWAAYKGFAAEVANALARFDPARVALEPVNEPPQSCDSTVWRDMQVALLDAARLAAPSLTLVAAGACGSMVAGLVALDPAAIARFAPLLFTFHFYEPYLFSHQGAPWMREPVYRALNDVPWPGSAGTLEGTLAAVRRRMAGDTETSPEAKRQAYAETERVLGVYFAAQPDRRFIEGYLAKVTAWGQRNGVPPRHILMGEFGALRTDKTYVASGAADRARYIRDVRESAEACGFPWAVWTLFGGMGLMDDDTRRLDPAMVAALGLAMPNG